MGNINLIIQLTNADPNYINSTVRYGRIDNTVSPVYTTISNVTTSPLTISDVANGQYRVYAKPNFSDGRICAEQVMDTLACTGITSLSAIFTDPNFVVSYSCDTSVPDVRINIFYPNGGFSNTIVTNDGMDVLIPAPAGVYGVFLITIQPVCDVDSAYYGIASAPVTVEIDQPSP